MAKERCQPACPPHRTTFCPVCGKADPNTLAGVRLMGFVGVYHTTNENVQKFLATGDPNYV